MFGFVPALDGLRAIAVLGRDALPRRRADRRRRIPQRRRLLRAVGFLITSLLLGEWAKRMTIRLGQFWARRARRLLPALLVMLVGVAIYAKVFATPGEFASLRLDSLSTLFYVANWHFIVSGGNYFASPPSPHPWRTCGRSPSRSSSTSCGPRWPCSCSASAGGCGRRGACGRPGRRGGRGARLGRRHAAARIQGGASVMRLYEGTDTRCQDILVGAALAIGMAMWAEHRKALPTGGPSVRTRSLGPGPSGRRYRRRHPRHRPTGGTCTAGGARAQAHRGLGDHRPAARVALQVARLGGAGRPASSCGPS